MKLVAVSVVKNEADIIEAFVRHTRAWTDHHFVLDHHSTDGTRQILAALIREGLPLTVFTGDPQADPALTGTNTLARRALSTLDADWVLPLNADEFLTGSNRAALERLLSATLSDQPVTLSSRDYSPTTKDDAGTQNPVLRMLHRQHGVSSASRVLIPRQLGLRPDVNTDRGNHALFDGAVRCDARPLTEIWLGRFALRSPQQEVLHVVTGELQRLSRGERQAGLDTHNRLGFQLLAQDPEAFFSTVVQPPEQLAFDPVPYLGSELRYTENTSELVRSARAFLPFLENLARSHGQLIDRPGGSAVPSKPSEAIQQLQPSDVPDLPNPQRAPFSGFVPLRGWQKQEGPVPSAFLPVFHWTTAPETVLSVSAETDRPARLHAEMLTYAERQVTTFVLNGVERLRYVFTQVNQREMVSIPLSLRAGENRLIIRHRSWINSSADPRKLAVIFLGLRVTDV